MWTLESMEQLGMGEPTLESGLWKEIWNLLVDRNHVCCFCLFASSARMGDRADMR